MELFTKERKKAKAVSKALLEVERREQKLRQAAERAKPAPWKAALEEKIPPKVYAGLESAFCKGFAVVFEQGRAVIEKSYKKEEIAADHAVRDYAVQLKGGRKELKKLQKSAKKSEFLNLTMTTAEGVGLGALGVGMPDIVLFLGTLLKGVYETSLGYGFDYESGQERLLILKMMETALSGGESWAGNNDAVDALLTALPAEVPADVLQDQIRATASVFAMDMLLLKFLQGIPVVGVLGGAANPVYYRKVMNYVELKYRKRYLLGQKG